MSGISIKSPLSFLCWCLSKSILSNGSIPRLIVLSGTSHLREISVANRHILFSIHLIRPPSTGDGFGVSLALTEFNISFGLLSRNDFPPAITCPSATFLILLTVSGAPQCLKPLVTLFATAFVPQPFGLLFLFPYLDLVITHMSTFIVIQKTNTDPTGTPWQVIFLSPIWHIWNDRNQHLFEPNSNSSRLTPTIIASTIRNTALEWFLLVPA